MATAGGPNIERDGLVFGMDTSYGINTNNISSRFYPGKPTTNYGPSSFGNWGTEASAERIATGNLYKGQPTYNCRTVVGESWRGIDTTVSGLRTTAGSSGTVTMSCMVRNNNSTAYSMYAYIGHDFGSTRTIAANSDWQRIQWTVNQSSMVNDYVEFRPYTNNANVYLEMTMPQVEVNTTIATPWTASTRSSTQSLIDLTRTSTIDVSNVSFDSTGQPTFDGTDDYIEVADNNSLDLTTNMTFEFVVKANSSQSNSYPRLIDKSNYLIHITQTSPFTIAFNVTISGGTLRQTAIGSAFTANNYSHIVCTYDGQFGKIYTNGSLVKTSDFSSVAGASTNSTSLKFGGNGTSDRVLNGEIPIAKVYSRALSADEIQQNYNAYKNRFNL
jgi:hypothetical protein